jgi:hypothetical protein
MKEKTPQEIAEYRRSMGVSEPCTPLPKAEQPQEYTVGFIFDPRFEIVALMRKNRPAWQAGKLNGIGGKFEAVDNNNPRVCMLREAKEEAVWEHKPLGGELRSYELDKLSWKQFARIAGKKNVITTTRLWVVHCFYTICENPICVRSREPDQPIEVIGVNDIARLQRECTHNTPWLLQMAVMSHSTGLTYDTFEIGTFVTT